MPACGALFCLAHGVASPAAHSTVAAALRAQSGGWSVVRDADSFDEEAIDR
ncbi:MAG TPA: hypothetical protein VIK64_00675 [Anaerolineales bacterium]